MGQNLALPPAFQRPNGSLYLNANQVGIVAAGWRNVLLDTVDAYFTDGIENAVGNDIRPITPGFYIISGNASFINTQANMKHEVMIQDVLAPAWTKVRADNMSKNTSCVVQFSEVVWLKANSRVTMYVQHDAGVNIDLQGVQPWYTHLTVQRVR
jgi:hypothetical protein